MSWLPRFFIGETGTGSPFDDSDFEGRVLVIGIGPWLLSFELAWRRP